MSRSRIGHNIGDGSEVNDVGGLQEVAGRSAERARRVFSSSPSEGNRKKLDEFPRQQTLRQGTAEPAEVWVIRSPLAVDRTKRSSTRSATSSQPSEGAAPPSPATRRDGPAFKVSPPSTARTEIPLPPADLNRDSRGGIAATLQPDVVHARRSSRDGINKPPPISRAASTGTMPIAVELPGAVEARRSLSFENASPRGKVRSRSTPSGDRVAHTPSSAVIAHGPSPPSGRGTRGKQVSSGGSTSPGNPSPVTSKRVDDR